MKLAIVAAAFAFLSADADAVTGNGIQHSNSVNGPWTYTSASGGWFYGGAETIYAWNREGVPVNFNGWLVYSPCNWHQAMAEVTLQPDTGLYNTGYGYQPTDRMLYAWCPAPQHPGIKCSTLGGGTTGRTCQ